MQPKSPVVHGLQQFETNIGGPQNGQPEFLPLPCFQSPDGRVMSRWELTDEERGQVALGADIFVTIWTAHGVYPPTVVQVGGRLQDPGPIRNDYQLDVMLFARIAQERMRELGKPEVCARCVHDELRALGGCLAGGDTWTHKGCGRG